LGHIFGGPGGRPTASPAAALHPPPPGAFVNPAVGEVGRQAAPEAVDWRGAFVNPAALAGLRNVPNVRHLAGPLAAQAPNPQRVAPPVAPPAAPAAPAGANAGLPGGPGAGAVLLFLAAEDLKLALKLLVAVVLLGQNGSWARLGSLAALAALAFGYQVWAVRRPAPPPPRVPPQPGQPEGGRAGLEGDLDAVLPPLEVRGPLEGGIAPGGGLVMDMAYVLLGLVASLVPAWRPLPAVDPDQLQRRRTLERRLSELRMRRNAERVEAERAERRPAEAQGEAQGEASRELEAEA